MLCSVKAGVLSGHTLEVYIPGKLTCETQNVCVCKGVTEV